MECNKEEAIRAKDIAEKRMQSKDFVGAQKLALKAQQLYPDLEDISQMLTICEVHVSAQISDVGLEMDWYEILQVPSTADELSIEEQYRNLTLLLHPSKNRFAGAEAAFKLIKEAHRVLFNKAQRSLYDSKHTSIQISRPTQPVPQTNINSDAQKKIGTQHNFTNRGTSQYQGVSQLHQQQSQIPPIFLTSCLFCNKRYQCKRASLYKGFRCDNCLQPIVAYDMNFQGGQPRANSGYEQNQSATAQHNPSQGAHQANEQSTIGNSSFGIRCQESTSRGVTLLEPFTNTRTGAQVASRSQRKASEDGDVVSKRAKIKEEKHVEMNRKAQTGISSGNVGCKRGRKLSEEFSESFDSESTDAESSESCKSESADVEDVATIQDDVATQNSGTTSSHYLLRSTRQKQNVTCYENGSGPQNSGTTSSHYLLRSTRQKQIVTCYENGSGPQNSGTTGSHYLLRSTRQKQIVTCYENGSGPQNSGTTSSHYLLRSTRNVTCYENGSGPPNSGATSSHYLLRSTRQKQNATCYENGSGRDDFANPLKSKRLNRSLSLYDADSQSNDSFSIIAANRETRSNLGLCVYPEPEFHDFDKDRVQDHFRVDQIWAVYDYIDGMPRFYVRIRKTYSHESKMRITWLEADPKDQYGLDWLEEKLPVACGNFKNGRTEDTKDLLMFSHLASWENGETRGTYQIYPRTGDVWAVFKDWSIEWSSNPDRNRKYEFEFIEILSDYAEGTGVVVASLVMLEGFTSLFQWLENMEKNPFLVPPNELLRFSHRVPYHKMTGKERVGIPKGSFELDPACLFSEGFSPSKGADKFFNKNVDIQSNSLCSKSRTEMYTQTAGPKKLTTSMKSTSPNEKNIQKKENLDDRSCSLRLSNCAHEKEPWQANASHHAAEEGKPLHGGPGRLDVLPNNKPGETNSTKCQAEVVWMTRPNDTSEGSSSSSMISPIQYPDPVFHSFESEKSEDKFQEDQIWALYCREDGGLPIYYAQIKKVESPEFKVHVTRLEPCPSLEKDILWSKNDLPFGCGSFKLQTGETEIFETAQIFSHQVRAVPLLENGRYYIWPWTGEVWAIYKNWSAEWTLDDVKQCEYELVEVLQFDSSVYRVLVLQVVDGFKTVYKGSGVKVEIMWHELLRFSHQVPSFELMEERGGSLRGYLQLDPAALPDSKLDKVKWQNAAEQRVSEGLKEGSAPVKPVGLSYTTEQEFNQIFEWPTGPSTRLNSTISPAGEQRYSESQQGGSALLKPVGTSYTSKQAEFNRRFEWPSTGCNCEINPAGEHIASEGQQGESVVKPVGTSYMTKQAEFNRIYEWPTSPSMRYNCVMSPAVGIVNSSTASRALSPEEAKDSQTFAEWAQQGFFDVGCPAEPAELEGVGDEHGKAWVQQCPKLFALFKPRPHYGTIMGVSDYYLDLIRSSLWGTFSSFVKEVAHVDLRVPNSQLSNLAKQLKALEEAGFPINILKNHLKASTLQAQQWVSVQRAALEALKTAKAAAPSIECLDDTAAAERAAEMKVLEIEGTLAETQRKLKPAKSELLELREQKATTEKEIEVACGELEAIEAQLNRMF